MRLTLRTLLAYMDGLLESKDSQEIGKKVEESKFATDLFHKIRDVMRRLRLGAPSVSERGANLDCNTVAEYLDNVLPADRVPDFEEVCLKSEMHLAEVASSHQILTMVLGEPAEIDPESRQRMYQLPTVANRGDEERLAASEAASALSIDGHAPAPPAPPVKARPRPVVPEYLRDPPKKRRLLPAAAIVFFLCAAIMLILLMLNQLNPGTPIGNFLQQAQEKMFGRPVAKEGDEAHDSAAPSANSAAQTLQSSGDATAADSSGAGVKPSGSSAAGPAGTGGAVPNKDAPNIDRPSKDPAASGAGPAIGPPAMLPDLVPTAPPHDNIPSNNSIPSNVGPSDITPSSPSVAAPAKSTGSGPAAPASVASPNLPIVPATPPTAQIQTVPATGPALPAPSGPSTPPSPPKPGPVANPNEVAMAPNKPVTPPPPAVDDKSKVARFTSDGQDVLLKFDPRTAIWRRVLPEEFLTANQTLLSLPSYRSRIDIFDVGATLELLNGTRVEILQAGPQAPPGVDIDYGHMVIKPLAQAGARLRVVVGSHTGTITLANVESTVGLEVTRVHDPGTDPEKELSHALTKLYVARGSATWEEGDKPPVRLTAPAVYFLDGAKADAPSGTGDVPKWITTNTIDELDQRAAVSVSQALPAERSASLGLMELTEARQKEIRWLAARCLGYLSQFDPLTAALNDADFRREWPDYFDQLKEAVARGPETASGIRQSLEKRFGNDSGELYRMLWGYTDKDLENGEDLRLIKNLDNEALIFRVLAFSNLRDIAHKGLTYHPEYPAAKRSAAVQRWKQEQKLGQIRWSPTAPKPRPATPSTPKADASSPPDAPPDATPPKPDNAVPGDVNPASATEPINSPVTLPRKTPAVVPEPEPLSQQPKVVFPEPAGP